MIATSENQTSGGSSAQKPNPNNNPNNNIIIMNTPIQKIEQGEEPVQLKQAGAIFECAASSLKYNIKHGKLPAYKENATAPYMVLLSDVERFLRETPGVASKFHPKGKPPVDIKDGPSLTGLPPVPETSPPPTDKQPVKQEAATPVKPEPVNHSMPETNPQTGEPPVSGPELPHRRRRRRPRRRGKGGAGNGLASTELRPLLLKALHGTTPQERLRITACLNELAGLVASA